MKEEKLEKGKLMKENKEEIRGVKSREREESLIRILSTDIPGHMNVYAGLIRIKGISWSFSNAICMKLGIRKDKKISELNQEDIEKISEFIKNPKLPEFILNRRKDFETGKTSHLIGANLDLQREFDIKKIRKIRSYKGVRHILGQPVRGQRTKSHFRKHKAVGVVGKAKKGKKG